MSAQTIRLPGVGDDANATLARLLPKLEQHQSTNRMLDAYYDADRNLKKAFGGVVPEQYYRLGLVLGWSAKGVDALGRRCNLERMVWADGTLGDFGFDEVWDGNRLESEVDQAITDTLVHGVSFGVASKGGDGEPGGLLHFYSAADATGERNPVSRQLDNLLIVRDRDKSKRVTALTLLLDGETIAARVDEAGRWEILDRSEHGFGVPAAPLVYRPRLRRPMGRSRLTRPVRGLQDAAGRALVRLEGHMDIYAYPEFWMLGADPSIFKNDDGTPMAEWMQRLGRIKGIPDDPDLADVPQLARADVKKFDAASPEPHLAALNAYAKLFARETSLPDSAVAITDLSNPTSAESYDAAQYELIAEAEGAVREFAPALRRLVPIAMAMQSDLTAVPDAWASIDTKWRDPRYQSRAAQADAGSKQIASVPWLAETEVGLELLGLDPQQIERALSERRRAAGNARIDALISATQQDAPSGLVG